MTGQGGRDLDYGTNTVKTTGDPRLASRYTTVTSS